MRKKRRSAGKAEKGDRMRRIGREEMIREETEKGKQAGKREAGRVVCVPC